MANDATNKTASNSNSTENTSLSTAGDQQKVPPLRIVLNSASNQKTSSTATVNQQASTKKDKAQDARAESTLKAGSRVRIKLGTNKPQQIKRVNEATETTDKRATDSGGPRAKDRKNLELSDKQEENINEDSTSNFNHLRRITRRSQRTIQSVGNEDDESISSMTSIDENLNSSTTQANSDITQDPEQSNPASSTSGTVAATNNATNGSSNTDTPRRYKRRKVETSESQSIEFDSLLGTQNYKLPHQNSFELFKNIRKQVDRRLESLNCVHPKTPLGLRDYMLTRGAYLLDGNKLGDGTSLFMNEDGGLNTAPLGKYHVIRSNKINYSVPNKAKVPTGLPANSPLHGLFTEQEKERYRMRIQHIKEREKLTLAAEQEFVRVYGQAALAAANQDEPFSVCTMLKHQEIYNYLDSDGSTILSREDAQQDQANQSDGVRTRRRQHGQISPAPVRRGSGVDEPAAESLKKDSEIATPATGDKKTESLDTEQSEKKNASPDANSQKSKIVDEGTSPNEQVPTVTVSELNSIKNHDPAKSSDAKPPEEKAGKSENDKPPTVKVEPGADLAPTNAQETVQKTSEELEQKADQLDSQQINEQSGDATEGEPVKMETSSLVEEQSEPTSQSMSVNSNPVVSDEERRAINRDTFLAQLQEIDDKWDKIRREMLIRHRNEAESLHAIQKLEWEWRTKETGACDFWSTLIIDSTLVPKLEVSSLDY